MMESKMVKTNLDTEHFAPPSGRLIRSYPAERNKTQRYFVAFIGRFNKATLWPPDESNKIRLVVAFGYLTALSSFQ